MLKMLYTPFITDFSRKKSEFKYLSFSHIIMSLSFYMQLTYTSVLFFFFFNTQPSQAHQCCLICPVDTLFLDLKSSHFSLSVLQTCCWLGPFVIKKKKKNVFWTPLYFPKLRSPLKLLLHLYIWPELVLTDLNMRY